MTPDGIGFALLLLGALLLVGKAIRVKWRLAQNLFLPSSILGGGVALLAGPDVLGRVGELVGQGELLGDGLFSENVVEVWDSVPELLISVVFATLFLGTRIPRPKKALELAGPQLALGFTMASAQFVIGIVLAVTLLTPLFGIDPMVGALIEIGFEGGHGTAAGLGSTFEQLGFEEGLDLALGLATIGIVSGVVIGIGLINWAVRNGHAAVLDDDAELSLDEQRGLFGKDDHERAATMTTRPASIEPLAIHVGIVAVAILLGQAMLSGLQELERQLWIDRFELFEFVPLFPLAMLGGVVVQLLIDRYDTRGVVDRQMMQRIQGLSLDVLIVAALATLSLDTIAANIGPFVILAVAGIGVNVAAFAFLARRMLTPHWFERGLADLGQSLGVTATGLLLVRVADPDNDTVAYEAFGYKQLGFEPFFGGGLVTALALPFIAQTGPYPLLAIMAVLLVVSLVTGLRLGSRDRRREAEAAGG